MSFPPPGLGGGDDWAAETDEAYNQRQQAAVDNPYYRQQSAEPAAPVQHTPQQQQPYVNPFHAQQPPVAPFQPQQPVPPLPSVAAFQQQHRSFQPQQPAAPFQQPFQPQQQQHQQPPAQQHYQQHQPREYQPPHRQQEQHHQHQQQQQQQQQRYEPRQHHDQQREGYNQHQQSRPRHEGYNQRQEPSRRPAHEDHYQQQPADYYHPQTDDYHQARTLVDHEYDNYNHEPAARRYDDQADYRQPHQQYRSAERYDQRPRHNQYNNGNSYNHQRVRHDQRDRQQNGRRNDRRPQQYDNGRQGDRRHNRQESAGRQQRHAHQPQPDDDFQQQRAESRPQRRYEDEQQGYDRHADEQIDDEPVRPADRHAFGEVDEDHHAIPPSSQIPYDADDDYEREYAATHKRPRAHSVEDDRTADDGFGTFYEDRSNGNGVRASVTLPGQRAAPRITRPGGGGEPRKRKGQRSEHGSPLRIAVSNNQPRFGGAYDVRDDFSSLSSAAYPEQRRILKIVKRDAQAPVNDARNRSVKTITLKSGQSITTGTQALSHAPSRSPTRRADVDSDTLDYTVPRQNSKKTIQIFTASNTQRKQAEYGDVYGDAPKRRGKGFGFTTR